MDMSKTGTLIAARRKMLGLTQEELSQRLNVTAKAVSKWERGLSYPDIVLISRLAVELRLSVVELISGEINDAAVSRCYAVSQIGRENSDMRLKAEPLTLELDTASNVLVSPYLFGENLEHTRSDVFMGLSAQMLRNRKFAGKPMACSGHSMEWYPIGDRTFFAHCEPYTRHSAEFYHMSRKLECNGQRIVNLYGGESGMGQHEIPVQDGTEYEFRIVAKSAAALTVKVSLTSRNGGKVYAENVVKISGEEWKSYELRMSACGTDPDADLRISFEGEGCLYIGAVSLMRSGHFRGMRCDVIERLKEMGVKMLRWPGGNFAGEYCWGDGLLPVDMRAPLESYIGLETQPHSMGYDYNEIDTDDFIALCRKIGAEPFITINPTWNSPEENAAWVEYCNGSVDTKYGAMRAARGNEEPYDVQFWSLGNEFGYGHMEGDNTPYGYSRIAGENAQRMLASSERLSLCSSGPYPDVDWAEHAAKPLNGVAQLVSLHYYAPSPTYADPAKLEEEYYECLSSVEIARSKVLQMRAMVKDTLKISFDEWNTWYAWYRPSSIVDGIFTALMMHMLIEEAERSQIALACHFEAINEGMMEVHPDRTELTASGQAFAMMKHHAGGILRYASSDASVTWKDGLLTATAVNPSFDQPRMVTVPADGEIEGACLYTCDRVAPFTRFALQEIRPLKENGAWKIEMPAHSLLLMQIREN
ncbi:MAG: helix-turn-helix domain-containing protein [Lachnospiraceae bacterium]|nr:helix-turn-helix domain-containing protein [Lachnospiraceae bacterium]